MIMDIRLQGIGHAFYGQYVFNGLTIDFQSGNSYCILGGNGSGKSTLLKIVYGALIPSAGSIEHSQNGTPLNKSKSPFQISLTGPYSELIEELTPVDFLKFYLRFRKLSSQLSIDDLLEICYLSESSKKPIKHFSSGMKQRLKLAVATLTEGGLIILDEPTSNLDPDGIKWFKELIHKYKGSRTLIIGSNFNEDEMELCDSQVHLRDYK